MALNIYTTDTRSLNVNSVGWSVKRVQNTSHFHTQIEFLLAAHVLYNPSLVFQRLGISHHPGPIPTSAAYTRSWTRSRSTSIIQNIMANPHDIRCDKEKEAKVQTGHKLLYGVDDAPPWYLSIILGLQVSAIEIYWILISCIFDPFVTYRLIRIRVFQVFRSL